MSNPGFANPELLETLVKDYQRQRLAEAQRARLLRLTETAAPAGRETLARFLAGVGSLLVSTGQKLQSHTQTALPCTCELQPLGAVRK